MNYEFLHKILPIVFKHEDFCYLYWSLTFLKVVAPKEPYWVKLPKNFQNLVPAQHVSITAGMALYKT